MVHVKKKLIQDKSSRDYVRWYNKRGQRMYDYAKINNRLMDLNYKVVKQEKLWWGGFLSTVWLGLDHSLTFGSGLDRKPIIFETMLFFHGKSLTQNRYSTLREAQEGHRKFKEELNLKAIAQLLLDHYKSVLYWKRYEIKNYLKELYEKARTRPQRKKSN